MSWPRSVWRPSKPDPSPATSSVGTRPPGATSTRRYSAAGGSARKPRRSGPSWRSSPADGLAVRTRTARPAPPNAPARAVADLALLSPAAPPSCGDDGLVRLDGGVQQLSPASPSGEVSAARAGSGRRRHGCFCSAICLAPRLLNRRRVGRRPRPNRLGHRQRQSVQLLTGCLDRLQEPPGPLLRRHGAAPVVVSGRSGPCPSAWRTPGRVPGRSGRRRRRLAGRGTGRSAGPPRRGPGAGAAGVAGRGKGRG